MIPKKIGLRIARDLKKSTNIEEIKKVLVKMLDALVDWEDL